jgi:glycosyltransferase involved in cell wall biosynthesis
MACGTPVVASDRGSLPEILGEAGRFFNPYRSETMLSVIQEVLRNEALRDEMGRYGLTRSKQFTWEEAARKAVSIFADLAEKQISYE